jgi:hypothetical protein
MPDMFYAVRRFSSGKVLGSRPMTLAEADQEAASWRESIGPAVTVPVTPELRRAVRMDDQAVLAPLLGPLGFYVSVENNGRYGLLAGPYPTKTAASARISAVKELARQVDERASWYAYGVTSVQAKPGQELPTGRLNKMIEETKEKGDGSEIDRDQ